MPPLGDSSNGGSSKPSMIMNNGSSFNKREQSNMMASLRKEVCQLKVKVDELEDDKRFQTIKLNELNEVINAYKNDEVHLVIMQKAMKSSELKHENGDLRDKIKKLEETKLELIKERDNEQAQNVELGKVIKSLQFANYDTFLFGICLRYTKDQMRSYLNSWIS